MLRKLVRLDQRRYGFPACKDPLPWSQQESCHPMLGRLTEAKSPLDIRGRVQQVAMAVSHRICLKGWRECLLRTRHRLSPASYRKRKPLAWNLRLSNGRVIDAKMPHTPPPLSAETDQASFPHKLPWASSFAQVDPVVFGNGSASLGVLDFLTLPDGSNGSLQPSRVRDSSPRRSIEALRGVGPKRGQDFFVSMFRGVGGPLLLRPQEKVFEWVRPGRRWSLEPVSHLPDS